MLHLKHTTPSSRKESGELAIGITAIVGAILIMLSFLTGRLAFLEAIAASLIGGFFAAGCATIERATEESPYQFVVDCYYQTRAGRIVLIVGLGRNDEGFVCLTDDRTKVWVHNTGMVNNDGVTVSEWDIIPGAVMKPDYF